MTTVETSHRATGSGAVSRPRQVAVISLIAAAFTHYAAVPGHQEEWWVFAVFFSAIGLFQLLWAALLFTGEERGVLVAGIAVNAGVLVLWALTRTAGLPFGPHAGEAEEIGALDVICGLAEVTSIVALALMLRGPKRADDRTVDAPAS